MTEKQALNLVFEKYNSILSKNTDTCQENIPDLSPKAEAKITKLLNTPHKANRFSLKSGRKALTALAFAACAMLIISLTALFLNSFFTKPQPDPNDSLVVYTHIGTTVSRSTDIFSCKVISKEKAPENIYFYNARMNPDLTSAVYTVEITETYRSLALEKGTVIQLVRSEGKVEDSKKYLLPLEIGKNYFIAGYVQVMYDKPVIADGYLITSEIADDGTLIPISAAAEGYFENIRTVDDYLEHPLVKEEFEKEISIPGIFEAYRKAIPYDERPDDAKLIEIIKKAIDINSDVKITVTPADYEAFLKDIDISIDSYAFILSTTTLRDKTDSFCAEVIDERELTLWETNISEKESFHKPVMYTVRINTVYRSLYLEEGMTVNVIRLCRDPDTQGNYNTPLKTGEEYIISGNIHLLNGDPVIIDDGRFTFGCEKDGTLFSVSAFTDKIIKINTDKSLLMNEGLISTMEHTYPVYLPYPFSEIERQYQSKEAMINAIKEAITVENKTKITVKSH